MAPRPSATLHPADSITRLACVSLGLEVTPPANRPKVRVSTERRTQNEHDALMDFHFKSGEITSL